MDKENEREENSNNNYTINRNKESNKNINNSNKNIPNKTIIIFGSGMVSQPVIDYLLKRQGNKVILASNSSDQLFSIKEKKQNENLEIQLLEIIKDKEKLFDLVAKSDLVISLVPTFFHIHIARACLFNKKNLISTSYYSDEIKKMDSDLKKNNMSFMFECGITPGLDHIIAFKVVEEQKKLGNKIIGYESWTGAIPSPESVDNPLLYKFSWNPKGALLVLKNEARQLINGKVSRTVEKNLFTHAVVDKRFHPSLNLEGYYNRDSIKYRELYNLRDAKSIIRGHIRYQGFTFVMQCFKMLKLLEYERVDEDVNNWREHLQKQLKNPRNQDNIYDMKRKYIKKGIDIFLTSKTKSNAERIFYFNISLLAMSFFDDKYIRKYGFENLLNKIYSALVYLDFHREDNVVKIFLSFFIFLTFNFFSRFYQRKV